MVSKKQQLAFVSSIVPLLFFVVGSVRAETLTSSSFQIENPTISVGGGNASSASFQYSGSLGEYMIGEMAGASFTDRSGSQYYTITPTPVVVPPTPTPTPSGGGLSIPPPPANAEAQSVFTGTAVPGSQVVVTLNNVVLGTTTTRPDGTFLLAIINFPVGQQMVAIRSIDDRGVESTPRIVSLETPRGMTTIVSSIALGTPTKKEELSSEHTQASVVGSISGSKTPVAPPDIKIETIPGTDLANRFPIFTSEVITLPAPATDEEKKSRSIVELIGWGVFAVTLWYFFFIKRRWFFGRKKHKNKNLD